MRICKLIFFELTDLTCINAQMHGGTCNEVQSNITRRTVVLKTSNNEEELLRILITFPVRIFHTSLVMESIEKGKPIDPEALKKHKWNEPSARFGKDDSYTTSSLSRKPLNNIEIIHLLLVHSCTFRLLLPVAGMGREAE